MEHQQVTMISLLRLHLIDNKYHGTKMLHVNILLIVIGICIFGCAITFIVIRGCNHMKKVKNLKRTAALRSKYTHSIRKPMVISINIGFYQNNPKNSGLPVLYVENLEVIDKDYEHIKRLCVCIIMIYIQKTQNMIGHRGELPHF